MQSDPKHFDQSRTFVLTWGVATLVLGIFWLAFCNEFDRLVLTNTIALGLSAAVIAVPLGLMLGFSSARRDFLGRLTLFVVCATAFLPLVFHVSCWDSAFGKLGWLTATSTGQNKPLISGWMASAWIHAVSLTPQLAMIFLVAVTTGSKVHEEQALIDSSRLQVFLRITLWRLRPVIGLAIFWCIVSCAREIAVTDIYQVGTLAEQVYLGFSLGQFDSFMGNWTDQEMNQAQSLGIWVQVFTIAWLVASTCFLFSRLMNFRTEAQHHVPTFSSSKRSIMSWLGNLAVLGVLAIIPIWNLCVRASFHVSRIDGEPVRGYSFGSFAKAIKRAFFEYSHQTYWSLLIALGCVLVTMILASIAAWVSRKNRGLAVLTLLGCSICFALPGPVIGSGLSQILSNIPGDFVDFLYNRTLFAPIVATVVICLPVATILYWFSFSTIPSDSQEHAATEGANQLQIFLQFGGKGICVSHCGIAILCFVLAYGELAASQMVLPPGVETVPRLTLGLMHSGVNEMTAALTIVNTLAIIGISLLGWWLVSLNWRQGKQQ